MFFNFLSAFAIAAVASAAVVPVEYQERSSPLSKRDATCNIGQAVGPFFIGSTKSGTPFCETHFPSGDLITSITTFSRGQNDIAGIKIKYASGGTAQYGKLDNVDQSGSIELAAGERISRASMAGNGIGTRLGKIYLETSKGQKVTLGKSQAQMHDIDIGTGLLIGLTGYRGDDIDSLALIFLAGKIDRITIDNFKFKDDPSKQQILTSALSKIHYFNALSNDLPVEFNGGTKVMTTHTYTQTSTIIFGGDVKVEAKVGIPEVADVSVSTSFKWEIQQATTNTLTVTREVDQGYSLKPTLKKGEGIDCQALIGTGRGDFKYTSTVSIYMKDGGKFWYPEEGTLSSEAFSSTDAKCSPNNHPSAPDGFNAPKLH